MTRKSKVNKNNQPEFGWFLLVLIIILFLLLAHGAPEKKIQINNKIAEKKKALEVIVLNIDEAKEFQNTLLKNKHYTTIIIRWVVFGMLSMLNTVLFLILGYHLALKDILECVVIVNPAFFTLIYIYFFLRYGKFIEIKNAYSDLQTYILAIRYGKTEEQIEAYLTYSLENRDALQKEIIMLEERLKRLEISNIVTEEALNTPDNN